MAGRLADLAAPVVLGARRLPVCLRRTPCPHHLPETSSAHCHYSRPVQPYGSVNVRFL